MSQAFDVLGQPVRIESLDGLHDLAVKGAAPILEQTTVGHLVGERVLEGILQVREGRGPFDLIFIDADKPSNPEYFAWALKLSRRGSLIIADNVVRNGAVVDAASGDPSVRGVRRFHELLAAEPRVSATAVQTVSSKGTMASRSRSSPLTSSAVHPRY